MMELGSSLKRERNMGLFMAGGSKSSVAVTTNTDLNFICKACTEPLTGLNALQLL